MKKNLHPDYTNEAKISCACGASLVTGSTIPEIRVELCSSCHPFYTGKQKFVDTARRVEKFQEKAQKKQASTVVRRSKTAKNAARTAKKTPKSES